MTTGKNFRGNPEDGTVERLRTFTAMMMLSDDDLEAYVASMKQWHPTWNRKQILKICVGTLVKMGIENHLKCELEEKERAAR